MLSVNIVDPFILGDCYVFHVKEVVNGMVRFIDVPVGAIFKTENGMKFKKVHQPTPDEYHKRPDQMKINCINLANNHKGCMGVLLKCWIVEEE